MDSARGDLWEEYRRSGDASAHAGTRLAPAHDSTTASGEPRAAAFFDVDNTIMSGSSLFHFARGLMRHRYFGWREMSGFAVKQLKFVLLGSEDLDDMQGAIAAGLAFVEGKRVDDLTALGEQVFDESMLDTLIPGTLELAQAHLDAGDEVWLVTATPIELAAIIAGRLGLTGALGTVAEVRDGVYTGELTGVPLHGIAKAEAVRALAHHEGLDLRLCAAYSDSANDIPMLSAVGRPCAVNPDSSLRAHAREMGWPVRDFRRREQVKKLAVPAAAAAAGLAVGVAVGRLARRSR